MNNSSVKETVVVSRDLRPADKTVLPPLRPKTPKELPPLPRTPGGRRKFASDSQLRCGVIQIIGGIAAIILGTGAIIAGSGGNKLGSVGTNIFASGIWGGLVMIIAGIFGVVSAKNEKTTSIQACLVCSVFSLLCSLIFIALSANMYAIDSDSALHKSGTVQIVTDATLESRRNIDIVSIIVGLMVFIVAIIQIVISGRALAHASKRKSDRRVFFTAQPTPSGNVPKVGRDGAIVIVPAGMHQHPRPHLPPSHIEDDLPNTPPPRYVDQLRE
ncbi:uncharacterized protein LOC135497961 isoform X2 [Lineus longissimus]